MIDDILRAACKSLGWSYRHASKSEVNSIAPKEYPLVIRLFPSSTTEGIVTTVVCTLYFCEPQGRSMLNTEGEIAPKVSDLSLRQMEFLKRLRIDQRVTGADFGTCTAFSGLLDSLLCGVMVTYTISHRNCK